VVPRMDFRILGEIRDVETIAAGAGIRELKLLRKRYGARRWRKRKGVAKVEAHGQQRLAEIHWYEGHGVGRVLMKIKRFLSES
jgi:hypothetical protein